ncbi:unnamed protein product [Arabis nemorensis]|uniref:Uncharacterized protein n=1 Tax=Arabis nemorensis TaxID=586526 RepID=A0A565BBQ4_9BRAS|nr:unnamed protein product [Arabis nemorensis]
MVGLGSGQDDTLLFPHIHVPRAMAIRGAGCSSTSVLGNLSGVADYASLRLIPMVISSTS